MRTFVRKIKLAVVGSQDEVTKRWEYLRKLQYDCWILSNRIVRGQLLVKGLEDAVIFKDKKRYEFYREIESEITNIKSTSPKDSLEKQMIPKFYEEIKTIKEETKKEFDLMLRKQS